MVKKITELRCANCDGEGWVCEEHPEVPWQSGNGCCGGAGMPCSCNKASPPWHFAGSDLYAVLFQAVKEHTGWDNKKIELWFETENPNIGNSTPYRFLKMRPEKAFKWIMSLINESTPLKL